MLCRDLETGSPPCNSQTTMVAVQCEDMKIWCCSDFVVPEITGAIPATLDTAVCGAQGSTRLYLVMFKGPCDTRD